MGNVAPTVFETPDSSQCPSQYLWWDGERSPPACVSCPDGYGYSFITKDCFSDPTIINAPTSAGPANINPQSTVQAILQTAQSSWKTYALIAVVATVGVVGIVLVARRRKA